MLIQKLANEFGAIAGEPAEKREHASDVVDRLPAFRLVELDRLIASPESPNTTASESRYTDPQGGAASFRGPTKRRW